MLQISKKSLIDITKVPKFCTWDFSGSGDRSFSG